MVIRVARFRSTFAGMPDIGPLELVIVLIIAIVVVGPKKLPQLGRSLGSGMREFKDSITGKSKDDEDEDEDRDAFGEPARRPARSELDPTAAEPEVVTGETRREDQPASHRDS
jgi:sec-independent protein translocase protein TatA